ncbi:DUF2497 domain-containing protein [Agrobacterium vaccinii]|uniref:DUF2497 domain-containing protein n=1 Tax=Agrobacterium vaccinii TaxID=2735528 RepID=UPI001E39B33A|nr:DUF2497 domain-containing protein [Agrobacterium vaccinii]UHS56759.1 DUF2497 domain-containing protein [Agrobacterium vaccinii]
MAQPSVAREPSMEEILASIRRIIESNEPASGDAFSAPLPPVYDEEEESEMPYSAELASPPAHVPPAANQGYGARQQHEAGMANAIDMAASNAAEKTMSLADVAARVRAAADRNASLGPQGFATQQRVAEPAPRAEPAHMNEPTPFPQPVFQQERPVPPPRPTDIRPLLNAAPTPRPQPAPQPQPAPSLVQPATAPAPQRPLPVWETMELRGPVEPEQPAPVMPELVVPQPFVAEPEQKLEPEQKPEETGLSLNLISAAAGAQIAQSFGELAELFDGVERPSVEQMAQDMLRPMLQDWLEDNLPTLVERLVREEIERVARGPRR